MASEPGKITLEWDDADGHHEVEVLSGPTPCYTPCDCDCGGALWLPPLPQCYGTIPAACFLPEPEQTVTVRPEFFSEN